MKGAPTSRPPEEPLLPPIDSVDVAAVLLDINRSGWSSSWTSPAQTLMFSPFLSESKAQGPNDLQECTVPLASHDPMGTPVPSMTVHSGSAVYGIWPSLPLSPVWLLGCLGRIGPSTGGHMDIAWFMDGLKEALRLNREATCASAPVRAVLLVAALRVGSWQEAALSTSGRDRMWSVLGLLDGTRSIVDVITLRSAALYSEGSGDACGLRNYLSGRFIGETVSGGTREKEKESEWETERKKKREKGDRKGKAIQEVEGSVLQRSRAYLSVSEHLPVRAVGWKGWLSSCKSLSVLRYDACFVQCQAERKNIRRGVPEGCC